MEERMLDDRKTLEKQNGGTVLRGLFRYVRSAESITTQKHKTTTKNNKDKTREGGRGFSKVRECDAQRGGGLHYYPTLLYASVSHPPPPPPPPLLLLLLLLLLRLLPLEAVGRGKAASELCPFVALPFVAASAACPLVEFLSEGSADDDT